MTDSPSASDTPTPGWSTARFMLDAPLSPPPVCRPGDAPAALPFPSSPAAKNMIVLGGAHPMTPSGGSNTSHESPFSSPESFPDSPFKAARELERAAKAAASTPPLNDGTASRLRGRPAAANRDDTSIKDSDEDDYGSDSDSLDGPPFSLATSVSLSTTRGSSFTVAAAKMHPSTSSSSPADGGVPTPPLTKRRANTVLTSPLPLRRAKQACLSRQPAPPKHKFDMKALLRHAEQDSAAEAAVRRAASAFAEHDRQDSENSTRQGSAQQQQQPQISQHVLEYMLGDDDGGGIGPGGRGGGSRAAKSAGTKEGKKGNGPPSFSAFHKDRIRRAFGQTEAAAVPQHWYFFKEHFVPSPAAGRPFPDEAVQGMRRWAFLQDASMRQDYFSMGVVRRVVEGGQPDGHTGSVLPDEVFLWILDEACAHPLPSLRAEYAAVLRSCPTQQICRLVDTERLLQLFQGLGPRWESIDLDLDCHHHRDPQAPQPPSALRPPALVLVPAIDRPYPGRDWAPLRALLLLLAELAAALSLETVESAVIILLRLGIDTMVEETLDVMQAYQEAMRQLLQRVPSPDWDAFCYTVCISLHNSIQKPALRWRILACLPSDTTMCHDFRRRLAAVFLFDEPVRAQQDPRLAFSGPSTTAEDNADGVGLARLVDREAFVLTDATDYEDLAGLVNLLDVYIDNAGREALVRTAAPASPAPTVSPAGFDADIDALAQRLLAIGGGINATVGSHVSRLDSRTALERVQIRLTHSVRTRRPGKKSVFDRIIAGVMPALMPGVLPSVGQEEVTIKAEDMTTSRPVQRDIRSFFAQAIAKKPGLQ